MCVAKGVGHKDVAHRVCAACALCFLHLRKCVVMEGCISVGCFFFPSAFDKIYSNCGQYKSQKGQNAPAPHPAKAPTSALSPLLGAITPGPIFGDICLAHLNLPPPPPTHTLGECPLRHLGERTPPVLVMQPTQSDPTPLHPGHHPYDPELTPVAPSPPTNVFTAVDSFLY